MNFNLTSRRRGQQKGAHTGAARSGPNSSPQFRVRQRTKVVRLQTSADEEQHIVGAVRRSAVVRQRNLRHSKGEYISNIIY